MINNLITLFLNFKYLKKLFIFELNKLTAQRLLNKEINKFVINKKILSTRANPDLLEKYKNICQK